MHKTTIGIIGAVLVLGGLVWVARPDTQNTPPATAQDTQDSGTLVVEEANNYDFGTISMAAGKVSHQFRITNTGSEPVTIGKVYTSCMCTTATLVKGVQRFGPYGMPGHGIVPRVDQSLDANQSAVIEVVFDPAAHGPAGVGRIRRTVTVEQSAGRPVELLFAAVVTP